MRETPWDGGSERSFGSLNRPLLSIHKLQRRSPQSVAPPLLPLATAHHGPQEMILTWSSQVLISQERDFAKRPSMNSLDRSKPAESFSQSWSAQSAIVFN